MSESIKLNTGYTVTISNSADVCPYCHHAIVPSFILATSNKKGAPKIQESTDYYTSAYVDIAFKCTHLQCSRLFISIYRQISSTGLFDFQKSVPLNYKAPDIPQEVKEVSPAFETIFGQAGKAKSDGLDQIAGVGYRKALEFLIKDFCISKNKDKEEAIKKVALGTAIENYIADVKIKELAKRAVWLGNDETHYVRKWEDKDINDLKIFIKLTCAWVEQDILSDKLIAGMTKPE